jgi:hypothetical protein
MSAPRPTGRPRAVTAVVVLAGLAGVGDLVLGTMLFVASGQGEALEGTTVEQTRAALIVLGGVLVVVAIAQAVLAVLLARGVNAARLALTLVLALRQAQGWLLVSGLDGQAGQGLLSLLVSLVMLVLLWAPASSRWFDHRGEGALARSLGGPADSRPGSRVLEFVLRLVVLSTTVVLSPGVEASTGAALLLAVIMISAVGWVLEPVFLRVALIFGWVGAVLLALFANAAVLGLGLWLTPGVEISGPLAVLLASWVYALVMTVLSWALSINGRDYLTVHAMRMSARGGAVEPSDVPGVVFVQLDGVPAPLLENEIRAGNIPTISRWVRSGSHTWTEWTARVPSTTPVSQAGLLHGHTDNIPAFRWFDRKLGRLLVANKPADATVIESRISDGRGLLADDGVSISNLFSGDAQTSLLTMSGLRQGSGLGLGPSRSYAAFFTHPAGILRAFILTVGEMVKEVFQARRQVHRGVEPRIHRGGAYVALRAVTNVFLRDLNVALVIEAMVRGARSVYVDFVDYDEIAHHAGVTRSESLAALYGLDDALRSLEQVIQSGVTPRPYHVVLVSDHGQSQGATFLQRYGQTLEQLVLEHMKGGTVTAATGEVEAWGPVNVFLGQLAGQESVSGRIARRAIADRDPDAPVGPDAATGGEPASDEPAEITVVGSGNLGGVWFSRHRDRQTAADIEEAHPGLLAALAAHPGIGFAVVLGDAGPVALGEDGTHDLVTGEVVGVDPLALFGPDARGDFLRVCSFDDAPDIYLNSLYDPVLDEVAAFEELVGCHGGLGGWQTRPLLVHPAEWQIDADLLDEEGRLRGAESVHHQFVRWLEQLGQREHLPADVAGAKASPPAAAADPPEVVR